MADLTADILQIYDYGTRLASPSRRITACSFLDKVIFAQPDVPLLFWAGAGQASEVPGLIPGERFWGVYAFKDILLLWAGSRLKWSDSNDFTTWIPVANTASSFVFTLTQPFIVPALGVESALVQVDRDTTGLVAGQFLRLDDAPYYTFFQVVAVVPSIGVDGYPSGFVQTIGPLTTKDLFLQVFVPYVVGNRIAYDGSLAPLEVQTDAVPVSSEILQVAEDFTNPMPGDMVQVKLTSQPSTSPGGYVSIGDSVVPGQDIFAVSSVDPAAKTMAIQRTGIGAVSSPLVHTAGQFIVAQPFVRVKNLSSTAVATGSFLNRLKEVYGFTVKAVRLTGAVASGQSYPIGTQMFTLDANEAGEMDNSGASINGEILQVTSLGELGYILKHRSIQSLQYVGPDQGVFYTRAEITDEGLLSRYAFVKVGLDAIYFWGNREIYKYSGGNQLEPIAMQFTKQLFKELDRSRADQILAFHKESQKEIWFVYPSNLLPNVGPLRVFIYNYIENSCTIDDYPASLQGLTAVARVAWDTAVAWASALGTWLNPLSWPRLATWASLHADVAPTYDLIGAESGESDEGSGDIETTAGLVHGEECYSRFGQPYLSIWESADMDNGDPAAWKYPDTIILSLQIKGVPPPLATVNVYMGTKLNTDDQVVWHGPKAVRVDALSGKPTKVNIPCAGKILRLRIDSNTADLQWRVSQFRILGRLGGTY